MACSYKSTSQTYELNNNNNHRGPHAPFWRWYRILPPLDYLTRQETFYRDRHQANDGRSERRIPEDSRRSEKAI